MATPAPSTTTYLSPGILHQVCHLCPRLHYLPTGPWLVVFLGQPHHHTLQAWHRWELQSFEVTPNTGRVLVGELIEERCHIIHVAAKQSRHIHGVHQADQTPARHQAVRRLEPHHPTIGGRVTNGAPRVRPQRPEKWCYGGTHTKAVPVATDKALPPEEPPVTTQSSCSRPDVGYLKEERRNFCGEDLKQ
ncbi:hypothetical protein E2C01_005254 [Portunus trituberculatus]|uniref:Uncharacterized protein n=1 Tax=Portunus trituberculatus TaxID=210409 RepID=A0A5B7CTJ2_PORTR|nr:hypothetical protein [Portunus trituberculatus]